MGRDGPRHHRGDDPRLAPHLRALRRAAPAPGAGPVRRQRPGGHGLPTNGGRLRRRRAEAELLRDDAAPAVRRHAAVLAGGGRVMDEAGWTEAIPTSPGHYRWRRDLAHVARVVHVRGEWPTAFGSGSYRPSDVGGRWYGPPAEPGGDHVENCGAGGES